MNKRKNKILNHTLLISTVKITPVVNFRQPVVSDIELEHGSRILMVYVLDVNAANRFLMLLTSLSGCKTLVTDPILPLWALNFPFPKFPQSSHLSLAFHLSETQDVCQHNIFLILRILEVDHEGSTMLF